jgi:hypothetical protein
VSVWLWVVLIGLTALFVVLAFWDVFGGWRRFNNEGSNDE